MTYDKMVNVDPVFAKEDDVFWGTYEVSQLSRWDYYRRVLGFFKETDKLTSIFELVKQCEWVIPCKNICFISERPTVIRLDNSNKPHCEDGPAISYSDGWSIYADHGVHTLKEVITDPDGFALAELKQMSFPEVKIILKKIGVEKFMSLLGTTPDTWTDLFSEIAKETINE